MKVYISADIEGTNGICAWDETEKTLAPHAYFAEKMTREVRAVCEGINLFSPSAQILVKDAHDTGRNLDHQQLPVNVTVNRGWSGHPYKMMGYIDETFDAAIMTGYHSGEGSNGNNLSHTMNRRITALKINGEYASEFLMNYYTALYAGVPVVMVSGDKALCETVQKIDPAILTVESVEGWGGSSLSRHPDTIRRELTETVQIALGNIKKVKRDLPGSFKIEIRFREHSQAYRGSFYPGVSVVDSHTLGFETQDYFEFLRMFTFVF